MLTRYGKKTVIHDVEPGTPSREELKGERERERIVIYIF